MRILFFLSLLLTACAPNPQQAVVPIANGPSTLTCREQQVEALKKSGLHNESSLAEALDVLLKSDAHTIPVCDHRE